MCIQVFKYAAAVAAADIAPEPASRSDAIVCIMPKMRCSAVPQQPTQLLEPASERSLIRLNLLMNSRLGWCNVHVCGMESELFKCR